MKSLWLIIIFAMTSLVGCTGDAQFKDKLEKTLKEHPEVLVKAIEENPDKIIEALNNAIKKAQDGLAKKRDDDEKKQLEESFNNPLQPDIRSDENIRGEKNAPIVLVEYSDFECPFCSRGFKTVMGLLQKYGKNIQFIYKHLPLSFHPQAMITAEYYEAIRLQNSSKAWKFHDKVLENQRLLSTGENFLKKVAKEVGADMNRLAADIKSKKVEERIKADMDEAQKFGFQGTPGFIINGIPVKGAYPVEHFEKIIDELKKRNKLTI